MIHYHQDVKTLTDSELKELSEELDDAYRVSGYEEDYWTDDEAEKRYYELTGEIRRREDERDPEAAAKRKEVGLRFPRGMMEVLNQTIESMYGTDREFCSGTKRGGKIGDYITIRKPARYIGGK